MWLLKSKYKIEIINVWKTPIGKIQSLRSVKCVLELPEIMGFIIRIYKTPLVQNKL
jgi:hypothetical protein